MQRRTQNAPSNPTCRADTAHVGRSHGTFSSELTCTRSVFLTLSVIALPFLQVFKILRRHSLNFLHSLPKPLLSDIQLILNVLIKIVPWHCPLARSAFFGAFYGHFLVSIIKSDIACPKECLLSVQRTLSSSSARRRWHFTPYL